MIHKAHRYLDEKGGMYSKWHKHQSHHYVHIGIYIGVLAFVVASVYNSTQITLAAVNSEPVSVTDSSATVTGLTNQILKHIKEYKKADEKDKSAVTDKISKIILQRKHLLHKEIHSNPKKFLEQVFPEDIKKELPESVQPLLEQEVTAEGLLEVTAADDFERGQSLMTYELETISNGKVKKYKLHFSDDTGHNHQANLVTGTRVKVKGVALEEDLVLAPTTEVSSLQVTGEAALSPLTVPQKTLVILINFTNNTTQSWTPSTVANAVFTAAKSPNLFFQANSNEQVSLEGDVVGWYTLPTTNVGCDLNYSKWMTAANTAATNAGVQLGNYTRKVYLMNNKSDCTYGGMGSIGGNPSWSFIFGYSPVTYPMLVSHELGHNFSTRHAQTIDCKTKQIDVYANCTIKDYGDKTDVMGDSYNGYYTFNAPHKLQAGWLSTNQVQTITSSGTYTVTPLEIDDSTIKALKVAKPNTNESYYISYRQPLGWNSGMANSLTSGISLHIWASSQTKMVDTTPGDNNLANTVLTDGRTFSDPANGIAITQLSHSTSSATVSVAFPAPVCVSAAPTLTMSPSTQSGSTSTPKTYSIYLKNNDSTTCAGSTFSLSTILPASWTSSFESASLSLTPGATGSTKVTVTPVTGVVDGTYSFTVKAVDSAVAVHTASASASYVSFTQTPDTVPPLVSITSPLNGAKITAKKSTNISATASDANGIASISILVGNTTLKTCPSVTTCTASWSVSRLTAGSYVLTAVAKDKSNLISTTSITVTR